MKQVKWFDRDFQFKSDQNIFPSIIERLWGTPVRLEEKIKMVPDALLEHRIDAAFLNSIPTYLEG